MVWLLGNFWYEVLNLPCSKNTCCCFLLESEAGTGSCCRPHGSDLMRGLWPRHSDGKRPISCWEIFFLRQRVVESKMPSGKKQVLQEVYTHNMTCFEFLCCGIGVFCSLYRGGWDHSCWNATLALCFMWHRNLWWLCDSNGAALAASTQHL